MPSSAYEIIVDWSSDVRSEERRVGKGVDLGGRRIIKKKKCWAAPAPAAPPSYPAAGRPSRSRPPHHQLTGGRGERAPLVTALALALDFFSSRRRHTRLSCDWSSDVCSSD